MSKLATTKTYEIMKKPSDDLFRLIKSLTKSEKRSFRLNAFSGSEKKKYRLIFDAIDAQESYDEEALKYKFRNEKWSSRFNASKHYVYKVLLRNLSAYNRKYEPSYQLDDLILQIKALQRKGFFSKCDSFIKRGKEMARESEDYVKLLEFLRLESTNHVDGVVIDDPSKIKQRTEALDLLENQYAYDRLYLQSFRIFSKNRNAGFDQQSELKHKDLVNSYLLSDIKKALTFESRRKFMRIHYFNAVGSRNMEEAEYWLFQLKKLFENLPRFIQFRAANYATVLLDMQDSFLEKGDFPQSEETLNTLKTLYEPERLAKGGRLAYIIEYRVLHQEIKAQNAQGMFTESHEKLKQLSLNFEKHQQEVSNNMRLQHYYLIAMTNFGVGQYLNCKTALEEIELDLNSVYRQDLIKQSRTLLFLVYFEMGKFDLLEYNIRSVKRLMKRKRVFNELEEQLFKLVKHLMNSFSNKEMVRAELEEIYRLLEGGRYVPNYREVLLWVESKLNEITFANQMAITQGKRLSPSSGFGYYSFS